MKHAFPEDELRPISCRPLTRDRENPGHIEINDVLGNYSLTLIDSLSTLAILASSPPLTKHNKPLQLFQDSIRDLIEQYGDGSDGPLGEGLRARGFDIDSKVQVFETAIRGLGGLLSAHLFAVGELPIRGYEVPKEQSLYAQAWHKQGIKGETRGIRWSNGFEYNGQLLRLAYDLGSRLIPAFFTETGIPYPRVNLRNGIPFYTNSPLNLDAGNGQRDKKQQGTAEITETCSAGAGSLVLEFTVLSRLTGDNRFEDLAKRAFWSIWNRRSNVGLIGSGVDAEKGYWIGSWTGIGAGIDSFFEYAFKSHVLLSRDVHPIYDDLDHVEDPRYLSEPLTEEEHLPDAFLVAWDLAHASIKRHIYRGPNYQHPHYIQADLITGAVRGFWMDSLSAYFPGLLTLAGHVQEAIETHLLTTALWTRFSALPERWNVATGGIEGGLGWWVGRPEFIESTYYLFRATEDPWYFHVGEMVLRDIKRRCWTRCGWAGIQNVVTGEQIDRMESFFLGETAKYLFLLFDPDHPLNKLDDAFVFTTEGHPLVIPRSVGIASARRSNVSRTEISSSTCPVKPPTVPFTISSTAARGDVYHAAALARLHLMPTRDTVESILGEYAVDHPSITPSDVTSPSNYTYFPWTLPPELVPLNATSTPMPRRPTFDIAFPTLPNSGEPIAPLQRVKEGILINFIGGLRLAMIQDVPMIPGETLGDMYRIHMINNLALGKDEKVFLAKSTGYGILNPSDPNFTRIRDSGLLDIVIDLDVPPEELANHNDTDIEHIVNIELPHMELESDNESTVKSAWNALLTQIASLLRDKHPSLPAPFKTAPVLSNIAPGSIEKRVYIPAITPTGVGAAPLPDWVEAPSPSTSDYLSTPLLWTKVYATDELCDHKLSLSVVRNHQVIVIKRGGCSFSKKLSNIPAFAPSTSASTIPISLQLVIIVSYTSAEGGENLPDDWLIRPLLDEIQHTSSGIPRQNPIPMVMVAGGEQSYDALRLALGVSVKRRYSIQTNGVPISNLIIL
jgi:Glycosyl hydrolase family 47